MQTIYEPSRPIRTLIATRTLQAMRLSELVGFSCWFEITRCVSSSASLSRYAAVDEPDLVVFEPSTCGGFTTIRHVQKEMQFGIVAAIGESEQESVLSALMEFPLTYVVLPTTREALLPAMHAAIARRNHQAEWCGMNERLRKQLDDRKIIERAKGQLMRRFSWTERDAFRRLQQSAMNQRTSMAELAEAVLNGSSVL